MRSVGNFFGASTLTKFSKIVTTNHYHVWTDALHARALAHQALNEWDRGTYVRWCVATAWIALEVACHDATGDDSISYRLQSNLDQAIENLELPALNWGSGIWQRVNMIRERRKMYVHRIEKESDLFPDGAVADEAIEVIRGAIIDIYKHVGQPTPPWIGDDDDRGWDKGPGRVNANLMGVHAGADPDSDDSIRICYVRYGVEKPSLVLPPGSQRQPHVEQLIHNIRVPISEVRDYEGQRLVESQKINMRGG